MLLANIYRLIACAANLVCWFAGLYGLEHLATDWEQRCVLLMLMGVSAAGTILLWGMTEKWGKA